MDRRVHVNLIQDLEIVVIAGGEGLRFKFDTPKQLVEIAGEILVKSTAQKLLKYTHNLKIIIPPDKEIFRQLLGNQFQLIDRVGDTKPGTGKHIEAITASSNNKNLLIVYGDCYFTENALERMFQEILLKKNDIKFFCRHFGYDFINAGGGEIFGVYIDNNHKKFFLEAAYKTQELFNSKKIWRDGTWEIAKNLKNHTIENEYREHPFFDFFFEINDLTDDLDFIEEYHNLRDLLPNTFDEAVILLEKIYKIFNNIAQKNKISFNSYILNSSDNISNLEPRGVRLGEIIELEFDNLKDKISALEKQLLDVTQSKSFLEKQLLDVTQSKSFRYTLILRKIRRFYKIVSKI